MLSVGNCKTVSCNDLIPLDYLNTHLICVKLEFIMRTVVTMYPLFWFTEP